jgi:phosphate starvation-inducible PhoH-like protein
VKLLARLEEEVSKKKCFGASFSFSSDAIINKKRSIHLKEESRSISVQGMSEDQAKAMAGPNDRNLAVLSSYFHKDISFRDNTFFIRGSSAEEDVLLSRILSSLYEIASHNKEVTEQDVIYACRLNSRREDVNFDELNMHVIGRTMSGRPITPKTKGQLSFVNAMDTHSIVFAVGPAGTGKTYLAVIQAVTALKKGDVKRIVLTRPAVEAGESLGFLPGDMKEKVDPYLTPLYDALHTMLGAEQTETMIEKNIIEIAPLAYMRGRTLDDSYVILDEAQNTTAAQMKMFLTRLGFHSHMVITGDITQIDLNGHITSGLIQAVSILKNMDDIAILQLTADDVVRHPLVQKIIERYEKNAEESINKHI